jgi:hypothetical protein
MEKIFNYGFVTVTKEDFADFLEEASPKGLFCANWMEYDGHCEICFENEEDYNNALIWYYSNFSDDIYYNDIFQASVFYDERNSCYMWLCEVNRAEKSGFASPFDAYEDCMEYLQQLNYTKEEHQRKLTNK